MGMAIEVLLSRRQLLIAPRRRRIGVLAPRFNAGLAYPTIHSESRRDGAHAPGSSNVLAKRRYIRKPETIPVNVHYLLNPRKAGCIPMKRAAIVSTIAALFIEATKEKMIQTLLPGKLPAQHAGKASQTGSQKQKAARLGGRGDLALITNHSCALQFGVNDVTLALKRGKHHSSGSIHATATVGPANSRSTVADDGVFK